MGSNRNSVKTLTNAQPARVVSTRGFAISWAGKHAISSRLARRLVVLARYGRVQGVGAPLGGALVEVVCVGRLGGFAPAPCVACAKLATSFVPEAHTIMTNKSS